MTMLSKMLSPVMRALSALALLTGVATTSAFAQTGGSYWQGVQKAGVLRCGAAVAPPYVMRDPATGEYSGFFADLQLAAQKMPMMIVTHDMWFAKNIASRVIFCAGGVVVEDGPPEQVLGSPKEERTRDFIDRVFHIRQ